MTRPLFLLFFVVFLAGTGVGKSEEGEFTFPEKVTTVEGDVVDLMKLAEKQTVVVIIMKAAWCPVCREQLLRIKKNLSDFKKCNITFLVICPGSLEAVAGVKKQTQFPYPFVNDTDFSFADHLKLRMSQTEMIPAVIVLETDLSIKWMEKGRGPGNFSDEIIFEKLDCSNWI
ncbi:MAG: redoxin family protein [Candidatus Marinimicrobia bacterium]|nr:redoxin family protein [Candidatus Neomarinimicrobiota bacterium]